MSEELKVTESEEWSTEAESDKNGRVYVHMKWLDGTIKVPARLRQDVNFNLFLMQVEMVELLKGNAVLYLDHIKITYGFNLDSEIEQQIRHILLRSKKTYDEVVKSNRG
jgi:hypothetical protein